MRILAIMISCLLIGCVGNPLDYEPAALADPAINCPGEIKRNDDVSIDLKTGQVKREKSQACSLTPPDKGPPRRNVTI